MDPKPKKVKGSILTKLLILDLTGTRIPLKDYYKGTSVSSINFLENEINWKDLVDSKVILNSPDLDGNVKIELNLMHLQNSVDIKSGTPNWYSFLCSITSGDALGKGVIHFRTFNHVNFEALRFNAFMDFLQLFDDCTSMNVSGMLFKKLLRKSGEWTWGISLREWYNQNIQSFESNDTLYILFESPKTKIVEVTDDEAKSKNVLDLLGRKSTTSVYIHSCTQNVFNCCMPVISFNGMYTF